MGTPFPDLTPPALPPALHEASGGDGRLSVHVQPLFGCVSPVKPFSGEWTPWGRRVAVVSSSADIPLSPANHPSTHKKHMNNMIWDASCTPRAAPPAFMQRPAVQPLEGCLHNTQSTWCGRPTLIDIAFALEDTATVLPHL